MILMDYTNEVRIKNALEETWKAEGKEILARLGLTDQGVDR